MSSSEAVNKWSVIKTPSKSQICCVQPREAGGDGVGVRGLSLLCAFLCGCHLGHLRAGQAGEGAHGTQPHPGSCPRKIDQEGVPGLAQPILLKLSVLRGIHSSPVTAGVESSFFLPPFQQLCPSQRGQQPLLGMVHAASELMWDRDGWPRAAGLCQKEWGELPGHSLGCGFIPSPASLT